MFSWNLEVGRWIKQICNWLWQTVWVSWNEKESNNCTNFLTSMLPHISVDHVQSFKALQYTILKWINEEFAEVSGTYLCRRYILITLSGTYTKWYMVIHHTIQICVGWAIFKDILVLLELNVLRLFSVQFYLLSDWAELKADVYLNNKMSEISSVHYMGSKYVVVIVLRIENLTQVQTDIVLFPVSDYYNTLLVKH